jgi:flagellar basal body-associated protein FliL
MRRLETQELVVQKKKKNNLIISIIMLLLLVLSTLGFAFGTYSGSSNSDNNVIPAQQNTETGRASLVYNGQTFNLLNSLINIESVPVDITIKPSDYTNGTLYIDSEDQQIIQEIASTLGRIAPNIQRACYKECEENIPEKDCTSTIIVHSSSTENRVYQDNKCIFIEGDLKAADAFLYKILSQ